MGVTPQICKSHNFWKFTEFSLGYIEVIHCHFLSFLAILMKSHTIIVKTLSEHMIIVILHFWVKNLVFEQKWFHFSKLAVIISNMDARTCTPVKYHIHSDLGSKNIYRVIFLLYSPYRKRTLSVSEITIYFMRYVFIGSKCPNVMEVSTARGGRTYFLTAPRFPLIYCF